MPFQQTQAFVHARSYFSLAVIIWPVKLRRFRVKRICYNVIHILSQKSKTLCFENPTEKIAGFRGSKRRVRASNSNQFAKESKKIICVRGDHLDLPTWRLPQLTLNKGQKTKAKMLQLSETDVRQGRWTTSAAPVGPLLARVGVPL